MARPGDSGHRPTLRQIVAAHGVVVDLLSHVDTGTLTKLLYQGLPRQEPRHRYRHQSMRAVRFERSRALTEDGKLSQPCDIPGAELPRGSS